METLSDWIWEVDQNLVYTYVSPKVQDLLGYDPEAVWAKLLLISCRPKRPSAWRAWLNRCWQTGNHWSLWKTRTIIKPGISLVVFETSGMPFFDAEGRFKGYRGVDRDITRAQADTRSH